MSESVENVKAVAEFLRDAAEKKEVGTFMHKALTGHADVIESAVAEIVKLRDMTSALPADLGSIHDLPQELLDELSVAKTDELEDQLVTVINAYGGEASLDQILVGLYRKFKVSQKRRFLQNKLYRMDTVWSVPSKKGVYTATEPQDASPSQASNYEGGGYEYGQVDEAPPDRDLDSEIPF